MNLRLVVVVLALATTGCGIAQTAEPATHHTTTHTTSSAAPAGSCHAGSRNGQPLPDPTCTPGVTNPDATQATLATTVCKSGWTKTIRPPASYTDNLKREQIAAYGYTDTRMGDYEEDHLISLELGGAPSDPHNLWPEPGASPNPKDTIENQLHTAVCGNLIPLTTAQHVIATSWPTAINDAGLTVSGSRVCLRLSPSRCA